MSGLKVFLCLICFMMNVRAGVVEDSGEQTAVWAVSTAVCRNM